MKTDFPFNKHLLLVFVISSSSLTGCVQPEKTEQAETNFPELNQTAMDSIWNSYKPEPIDEDITTDKETILELKKLRDKKKFGPEEESPAFPFGYVGLLPEENQEKANQLMNASIERLIKILEKNPEPTKDEILAEFKVGVTSFDGIASDTVDKEKVCEYYTQIREIIGFETTNSILNDWLYGFI